jgi:hypothetical protein
MRTVQYSNMCAFTITTFLIWEFSTKFYL